MDLYRRCIGRGGHEAFALINYEVYEYYWEENGAERQVGEEEYNVRFNAIYPKGTGEIPAELLWIG